MQQTQDRMSLMLISNSPDKAAMLTQLMEQQGLNGEIHRLRKTQSAVACARRSGRYRHATPHDFILLDFSKPDERNLSIAKDIAFGQDRAADPVVFLTSSDSEGLLDSAAAESEGCNMFAPISLTCFLKKMREHSRRRFMRALTVMYEVGPLLVHEPEYFRHPRDHEGRIANDEMFARRVA